MTKGSVKLGLPNKMEFHDHGSHVEIVRKWFGWKTLLLTAFVAIWDGATVILIRDLRTDPDPTGILLSLVFLLTAVGITYWTLAAWLNRTHISVSHGKITVRHQPIPFFGNKEIAASDVEQLYTREIISHDDEGTTVTYEVHVKTHSPRITILIRYLEDFNQALFIEQEIEKHLGIADMPVEGELSSPYN